MELTDTEILAKFREEDSRHYAFNLLVRKHQQKLYAVIRRLVIDHEDTNDLAQNAWIKVWDHLHSFKSESQLSTWLYRIAVNEALTFLNKKKKRFFLPIHDLTNELSEKLEAGLHFDGNELEKKLQKAILSLPEKQRVVFQLRYYDELSYEQISEILGTTVGGLKASYHHAAKKIEEYITKRD